MFECLLGCRHAATHSMLSILFIRWKHLKNTEENRIVDGMILRKATANIVRPSLRWKWIFADELAFFYFFLC